jgi:hypothetical protein
MLRATAAPRARSLLPVVLWFASYIPYVNMSMHNNPQVNSNCLKANNRVQEK